MNAFIFVSVICMGQQCTFFSSNKPITEASCQNTKKEFLSLPFKPEVTIAAAQCMVFESERKWL
jgi:hypothetical protein